MAERAATGFFDQVIIGADRFDIFGSTVVTLSGSGRQYCSHVFGHASYFARVISDFNSFFSL